MNSPLYICAKCGVTISSSIENFTEMLSGVDMGTYWCKECIEKFKNDPATKSLNSMGALE